MEKLFLQEFNFVIFPIYFKIASSTYRQINPSISYLFNQLAGHIEKKSKMLFVEFLEKEVVGFSKIN